MLVPLLAHILMPATAYREVALLRAGEERWVTRSSSSLHHTTPRLCTRLTSLLEELPGLAAAARADTVERVANNNWQINIANILFLISYPLYVCTRHFALFRMVFYWNWNT